MIFSIGVVLLFVSGAIFLIAFYQMYERTRRIEEVLRRFFEEDSERFHDDGHS
jgi:hypothetical protein